MPDRQSIGVLIFPAGEINSIELHDALATSVNIRLYGASSIERHGPYIFHNYIGNLPLITDPNFIPAFNKVLEDNRINVIFPTHDDVADFFVKNQGKVKAKVIAGTEQATATCRDKDLTDQLFNIDGIMPQRYTSPDQVALPAFVRPRIGAGSVGARALKTAADLADVDFSQSIVTEFLPGAEYTVDCLTDKNGRLRVVSPRSRNRTLAGVSVSAETQELTPEIQAMAELINQKLSFLGLWFFQIKKNANGQFKLLEVSTRGAGTMCLTRVRGANLPLLSVYVALDLDIDVRMNDYRAWVDRTLISRYRLDYDYDTVYLDFDDTVIINNRVHLYAMMFIYQCQNQGKTLHLLTRHTEDIEQTLRRYCIDRNLFASILQIDERTLKIDQIKPERAIFIDNSFQERKLVHDRYKLPVFDVDALEALLDWRT